ncbi:MAG: hypothetical protein HY293_03115 [Planctomycetes bacterium]|nr:hypothetical protein [Planctomycetota bacterium]
MKRIAALMLLLASCAQPPTQNDYARQALEAWMKSAMAGDAEKTVAAFSDAYKSEWLYLRLQENDPIARRWRGDLSGSPRTALDLWWGVALKHGNGRDEPAQATVLYHPSFVQMFREYFIREAQSIRDGLSRAEVTSVYGDNSGVTVVVKSSPGGPPELYGMVYERDGWKIDNYKGPQGGGR